MTLAHALASLGERVVAARTGYTNELGIVLAVFGLTATSLRRASTWRRLLWGSPLTDAWILVELGADFRHDIPWFLRYFSPEAAIMVSESDTHWRKETASVEQERSALLQAVPTSGCAIIPSSYRRLSMSAAHTYTVEAMQAMPAAMSEMSRPHTYTYALPSGSVAIEVPHFLFPPHGVAVHAALLFLHHVHLLPHDPHYLFFDQLPFADRLHVEQLQNGSWYIADTYKAIPHCTCWLAGYALRMPVRAKIIVLGEPRPHAHDDHAYSAIAHALSGFDAVYVIGATRFVRAVRSVMPGAHVISKRQYSDIARDIATTLGRDDLLVLKGSFTYELDQLIEAIKNALQKTRT